MKHRRLIIILSIIALFVAGFLLWWAYRDEGVPPPTNTVPLTNTGEPVECYTDADCITTGCSGTVCAPRNAADNTVTTCEFQDTYACFAVDNCICQNNTCNWRGTTAFRSCVTDTLGDPCEGLSGDQLEGCEQEQLQDQRCSEFTGMEYINCRQQLYR